MPHMNCALPQLDVVEARGSEATFLETCQIRKGKGVAKWEANAPLSEPISLEMR